MKLENWGMITVNTSPYEAPELSKFILVGEVYGSERFDDGQYIRTSHITGIDSNENVLTSSGSRYKLGEASKDYEDLYPDAYNRLVKALRGGDDD